MRPSKCGIPSTMLLLCVLLILVGIRPSSAFVDLKNLVDSVSDVLESSYQFAKKNVYCNYAECCDNENMETDVGALHRVLDYSLFGQHIAKQSVVNAIGGHLKNLQISEKPLVMSFHGPPGTGKNFVTEQIVRTLYKNGANSKFVHKYLGRIHFPMQSEVEQYKYRLLGNIADAVANCPRSLFIFDEVEKMPAGLFDAIVALLDNHAYTKKLEFRQSIFIFLSNVGGPEIASRLTSLLEGGQMREDTKLHDFEVTLENAAYNLKGGLHKSELIASHVIDHFVPFLPLELRHVENCIRAEYRKHTWKEMDDAFLKSVMKEAVAIDDTGMFSNNGCKRVSKKVEALYYGTNRKEQNSDL